MQDKLNRKIYSREALVSAVNAKKVISFDIFDTLVMRKVYINKDIFRLLALRFPEELRDSFYKSRVRAQEVLCAESYPYVEAIYDEVARLCPTVKGHEPELIAAEIELEKEMILPREDVVAIFELAKQLGKTVNIVSDMYFHEDTMRSILTGSGIAGYHGLYISSEYHTGKPQHLFKKYLQDFSAADCLHIGDSWECDILPAQKLGIDTFRLKMSTEIYEYEENTIPPSDLMKRKEVAEYVAVKYNSPFATSSLNK